MTMSSFAEILARRTRAFLPLVALAAGISSSVQAAPPAAPSKPVVTSSLFFPQGTTAEASTGTARLYKMQWEDNSLDESGFRIEVRYGNSGPFLYVDSVLPNVTQHVFVNDFTLNMLAQFRVVAFKHNGKNVESSESPFYEEIVQAGVANLTAPLNFTYEEVNDGVLRFSWNDRSTNEKYFQIFYKKSSETADKFVTLGGLHWFDSKEKPNSPKIIALVQHGLPPGGSYNFAIRATREEGTAYSGAATAVNSIPVNGIRVGGSTSDTTYIVPHLAAPTNIAGEAVSDTDIRLRWKDNSYNETGYEVQYRRPGSTGSWEKLSMARNSTTLTLSVGPGGTLEWRVRAIATGSTLSERDPADYTATHTITMGVLKPAEELTASTSGAYGTVDLLWADTSENETYYDIYTRVKGGTSTNWLFCQSMLADTTRASVTSYNDGGTPKPFELNVEYEFQVIARYANVGTESEASNIASATPKHGFTSRTHQPAKVGVPFEYEVKVSNSDGRQSWSVTDLPDGLTFDESNGKITGTPTVSGVFSCPMLVTYISDSATIPLTLRILKANATPTVIGSIDDVTLGTGTQVLVNVEGKFADADSEKAVRLKTTRGDIDMLLYPSLTPEAVNNFMGYVNSGAYNGVVFHRSVPQFIVQGGAYVPIQSPNEFASLIKRPASKNEPGISNIRGTVAHAKVGGNPDSATHDFFFNLEDNSLKEDIELDNQNAGFTVFARVAGDGMSVVDGIAALPIGQYKDFSGSTYDSNLDRRVILDGSPTAFTEIPMNVTDVAAPTNMDISRTVQILSAKEVSLFKYEIHANSNPEVARPSIVDGKVMVEGLGAGTSTITVRAKDLDNNPVDENFTVTVLQGHKLAEIKRQPTSVAVAPGKKATLTVTTAGSDLQYQWEKKTGSVWGNVAGQTTNVLNFAALAEADVGEYRLQVWNISSRVVSDSARVDLFTAPLILTHPVKKVVEVGKPLELEATASGAPAPVISWLNNGKAVAKQKASKLVIPAVALKDAGMYTMRAKNNSGSKDSNPAHVIVVDKGNPLMLTLADKTVVLKAQAAGVNLKYQWRHQKTGAATVVDVVDDAVRITGSTTATLTIKRFGVTLDDIGLYTCVVTDLMDSDLTGETGPWRVGVAGVKPVLTGINPADPDNPFQPDAGYVGIDYDYTLPGGGNANTTIASYVIAGLPPGLKVEATTGRIVGKPTRAGEYTLKLTAKNPKGTTVVDKIIMYVLPMPEAVLGSFMGQIAGSPAFNNNKGGRVDMTVTEAGLISGKLSQGKEILSFTGRMTQSGNSIYTNGTATVIRKGKSPLTLTLSSISPSGYSVSGNVAGTISDGTNTVSFGAYRSAYNAAKGQRSPYIGRQHMHLMIPTNLVGDDSVPQGSGYAVVTMDANGGVKAVGKMADGTSVTSSSSLGGQQQFLLYQSLYKNTGAVVGQAYLYYLDTVGPVTARTNRFRVDGSVMWTKEAQAAVNERTYKAGFGPLSLTALGMTYVKPGTNQLIMSLPKERRNASLVFDGGGLEDSTVNPDLSAISIGFTPLVPNDVANNAKVTLKIVPATGLFNGGFQLAPPGGVKRSAKYFGLVIPQIPTIAAGNGSSAIPGSDALGAGYFTLMQLPAEGPPATTIKNSPILSGSVALKPVPITITQQPLAVTVNPGQEVNLSVVASTTQTAQLKYQWRINGTNIPGATTSTYKITSANEGHEGDYDVVIKTDFSTVVSAKAVVTVNDPVSKVTIARTPATNPVLEGTLVTYTVTADGTGPFTYQWLKGNTPIVPAEGDPEDYGKTASLVIDSATPASAGVYNVRVTSAISTGGILATTGNELTVANPISTVVAIRTPDAETLNIGAAVNFTLTVNGSVGPFTYKWYRNGEEIGGATSANYAVSYITPAHAGVYKVKVSNAVTPDGVMSNEVPLLVSTAVANVQASRSPTTDAVAVNAKVTFTLTTQGAGPFTFQWSKKAQGSSTWVNLAEGNQSSYVILNAQESDQGHYRVLVSNETTPGGVMSNEVPLLVLLPVSSVGINLTPDDTTPPLGQPFSLHAAPNSVGPYSYQWFKDNSPIPGAVEATFSITTPSESDSGSYHVEVSNAANSAPVLSEQKLINFVVPESEP